MSRQASVAKERLGRALGRVPPDPLSKIHTMRAIDPTTEITTYESTARSVADDLTICICPQTISGLYNTTSFAQS